MVRSFASWPPRWRRGAANNKSGGRGSTFCLDPEAQQADRNDTSAALLV